MFGGGKGGAGARGFAGLVEGYAVQAFKVAGDARENPFGDVLALFGLFEELLVGGIAEKGNFRQDRRFA